MEIRESHDVANYFDLAIILGFFAFDFPFKYKWFYRMEAIEQFFEELQASPLLKVASRASKWVAFSQSSNDIMILLNSPFLLCLQQCAGYYVFTTWYVSTYFLYFLTRWGIFYWSLEGYYVAIKTACAVHFGIPTDWEGQSYYYLLLVLAFVIFFQQIAFLICGDLLAVSGILTMNQVATDLDRALQHGNLADKEVLSCFCNLRTELLEMIQLLKNLIFAPDL